MHSSQPKSMSLGLKKRLRSGAQDRHERGEEEHPLSSCRGYMAQAYS